MLTTSVTTKGQVTIPKEIRDKLGIIPGSRISFLLTDSGLTLTLAQQRSGSEPFQSGFGMLAYAGKAPPPDIDLAHLATP
jgi:antitoxin PrlF